MRLVRASDHEHGSASNTSNTCARSIDIPRRIHMGGCRAGKSIRNCTIMSKLLPRTRRIPGLAARTLGASTRACPPWSSRAPRPPQCWRAPGNGYPAVYTQCIGWEAPISRREHQEETTIRRVWRGTRRHGATRGGMARHGAEISFGTVKGNTPESTYTEHGKGLGGVTPVRHRDPAVAVIPPELQRLIGPPLHAMGRWRGAARHA